MLSPPASASSPDTGTAIYASGTPCAAAYPMAFAEQLLNEDIRKIPEYSSSPSAGQRWNVDIPRDTPRHSKRAHQG